MPVDTKIAVNNRVKDTLIALVSGLSDHDGKEIWEDFRVGADAGDLLWKQFDAIPGSNEKLKEILQSFPEPLVFSDTEKRKYGRSIAIIKHLGGNSYPIETHRRLVQELTTKGRKDAFNYLLYAAVNEWDTQETSTKNLLAGNNIDSQIGSFLGMKAKNEDLAKTKEKVRVERQRIADLNESIRQRKIQELIGKGDIKIALKHHKIINDGVKRGEGMFKQKLSTIRETKRLAEQEESKRIEEIREAKRLAEQQELNERVVVQGKELLDTKITMAWDNGRTALKFDNVFDSIDSLKKYVDLNEKLKNALREYTKTMNQQVMNDKQSKDMFDSIIGSLADSVPPPFTAIAKKAAAVIKASTQVTEFELDPRNTDQIAASDKQSTFDGLKETTNKLVNDLVESTTLKVGSRTNNNKISTNNLQNKLSNFHGTIESIARMQFQVSIDKFFGISDEDRVKKAKEFMASNNLIESNELTTEIITEKFKVCNSIYYKTRGNQSSSSIPDGIQQFIELHLYCLHIVSVLGLKITSDETQPNQQEKDKEKLEFGERITAFVTGSVVGLKIVERLQQAEIGLLSRSTDNHTYSSKTVGNRNIDSNQDIYGTFKYMADEDHVKLMGINCLWIVQNINPFLAGLHCDNINDVNKVKSYRKEYIDLVNGCVNAGKENSIGGYLTSLRWTTLNFRTAFWDWKKIEDSVDKIALTKPDDILC